MRNLLILLAITSLFIGCTSKVNIERDINRQQLKSVSWSPKGESVLYGGYDGNLYIRSATTKAFTTIHHTHTPFIIEVSWSSDGQKLLAITDKTIELLDVHGKEILFLLTNPPLRPSSYPCFGPNIISAKFSPDSRKLAIAGWTDGRVQIVDTLSGKIVKVFTNISKMVSSISWNPDSKYIAVGAWDKTIRILDVDSGNEIEKISVEIDGWVKVRFSPDGERLAWNGYHSNTWIKDIETGREKKIEKKLGFIAIDWSPDGKQIALLGWDTLDIWLVDSSRWLKSFVVKEWMDEVAWSPDGQYLAVISNYSGRASIWNVETGSNQWMNDANPLEFSPNMKFINIGNNIRPFFAF